ncbi:MAG: ABC transporter, partial [Opitutus sp.]
SGSDWISSNVARLSARAGSTLTFTPLIETSEQAGDIESMMLQFAQPDDVSRQITPSGKRTIAALVSGKFQSAFPNGAPKDEPPATEDSKPDEPAPAEPRTDPDHLAESKDTSTLFIIADTDWLFDDYSLRKYNFFGQTAAEPFNDNLSLAANTVEFLGGSQDLISIRGKGTSIRPFNVVRKMEAEAQKRYQEKLTAVDAELSQLAADLSKLQGETTTGNRLVATPEMTRRIEEFQKQQAAKRGERREIRRALREDIDRLENRLLIANLLATPLLVGAFGLWFHQRRRK